MNNQFIHLFIPALALGGTIVVQCNNIRKLTEECETYKHNTNSLLSDIKTLRNDSTTQAYQVNTLKLSVEELKKYKEQDLKTISDLKVKLKQVSSVSKNELKVNAPINAAIHDTVVIVDSVPKQISSITYKDKYMDFDGTIQNDSLKAKFSIPVTISQVLYKIPKHHFLWFSWGCRAIKQMIITNNPYVQLKYSEYIEVK